MINVKSFSVFGFGDAKSISRPAYQMGGDHRVVTVARKPVIGILVMLVCMVLPMSFNSFPACSNLK